MTIEWIFTFGQGVGLVINKSRNSPTTIKNADGSLNELDFGLYVCTVLFETGVIKKDVFASENRFYKNVNDLLDFYQP